jgi:hypothetical protein
MDEECIMGYVLKLSDGKEEFTKVFDGARSVLETLKQNWLPPEYHGPKEIKGCRWEIRPAESVAA